MIDLHAFVDGIDSLVYMDYAYYSAIMPQPERFSLIMSKLTPQHAALIQYGVQPDASAETNPPLNRISLVELGIFKLTALFVARYGLSFRRALMRRVVTNPQFEFLFFRPDLKKKVVFLEETESRYYLFSRLVGAYTRAVKLYWIGRDDEDDEDDCPATLLEFYFGRLQLAKLDEGVIDLHAFVRGADYFARMETPDYDDIFPPPERLSVMMNRPRPLGSQFTEYPARDQGRRDLSSKLTPVKGLVHYRRKEPLYRFPLQGITLKELGTMKLAAQFCVRYGRHFESWLFKRTDRFEFLLLSNSWFDLYGTFLCAYTSVMKLSKKVKKSDDGFAARVNKFLHRVERMPMATAMIDLHAFMGGVDYFAYTCDDNYSAYMAQPERLSMMIIRVAEMQPDTLVQIPMGSQSAKPDLDPYKLRLPQWAVLVEHGIMKLTALFAARYGMYFYWDLWKKVGMKPQFKFMEPSDRNFKVYNRIADAYEGVLEPADRFDTKDNACTETVVDAFLSHLQLEKLEEGKVTAMLDLHAFVCGVDDFADVDPICWDQEDDIDFWWDQEDFICSQFLSALFIRLMMHVSPQLSPETHLF